jgi:hypothetical protein
MGFVVDKVALGQVFLRVIRFSPVNIIPPSLSMFIYYLGDEQYARWWPQFRDVVSPHQKSMNLIMNKDRRFSGAVMIDMISNTTASYNAEMLKKIICSKLINGLCEEVHFFSTINADSQTVYV